MSFKTSRCEHVNLSVMNENFEDHLKALRAVFTVIRDEGLTVN